MDREGVSSPLFLGTGSTGMLLITNKPITEQHAGRSYHGLERTSEHLPPSYQHNIAVDQSKPYCRSMTGHSDSGISNGASLSPSSRYHAGSSLDKSHHLDQLDTSMERLHSSKQIMDTSIDRFNSSKHGMDMSIDRTHTAKHHMDTSLNGVSRSSTSSPGRPSTSSPGRPSTSSPGRPSTSSPGRPHGAARLSTTQNMCSPGRSHSMARLLTSSVGSGSPSRSSLLRSTASSQDSGRSYSRECGDLHGALEESEQRRQLLVDRLRDAQDTIKMQSHRLSEIEESAKDTDLTMDDMRFREKELRKKVTTIEREKGSYHDKYMDSLKSQEQLQHRMELISTELASLRTSTDLAQSDYKRKENTIRQLTSKANDLEEENNKHIQVKDGVLKELSSLRQSLEFSRSHTEYLEGQDRECKGDIDRLREDNQSLIHEKRSVAQKMATLETRNYSLTEENKTLVHNVQNLNDEKLQMTKQLATAQDTLTDLKTTLAVITADKERFFQHKLELSNQIHMNNYDKDNWTKLRCSLEDQVNELNMELMKLRQELEKTNEEKRKQEDEFTSTKQVSEMLSIELSKAKSQLEHVLEQNQSLEQNKSLTFKQHGLYDQEIQSMDLQLKQHKQTLTSLKEEHQKDRTSFDQQTMRLKDEMRDIKSHRNQMELKCHEIESKLRQAEQNLREHSDDQQREIDNWKSQCEKLTATNSRKDLEIETFNKRIMEMEDQNGYLKVNHDIYQTQCEELAESREETKRLREESRRLLQERAENQQVIQLLEMQKNILAKTSEGSMSKIHDAQQLHYTIEQLTVEKQQLQEELDDIATKHKTDKKEGSTSKSADSPDGSHDLSAMTSERISELDLHNEQLRLLNNRITEQLTKVEQENVTLQTKCRECVSKAEYKSVEREREQLDHTVAQLEHQLSLLQRQNEQLVHSRKSTQSTDVQDTWVVEKEKESLDNQVSVLTGQITALQDDKRSSDDKNTHLQNQLDAVHEKLFNVCQEDNSQVSTLQKHVNQLVSDLEESKREKTRQDKLVHNLKEELEDEKTKKPSKITQSLDAVGEDLTAVRNELQQLGDVIQGKDMEIEQLERQLRVVRQQLSDKEKQIEMLTTGTGSGKEEAVQEGTRTRKNCANGIQRQLEEQVEELEDEKEELTDKSVKLRKERDLAVRDAEDLRDALEDMKKICDHEHPNQLSQLKKELSAKDRQIESLEEQLRRNTNVEIKKLKRGASKVDLLKAENRRLQSQITSPTSHMPKYSGPPALVPSSSSPPTASSVGIRLGERLQGGVSSPSQRLLSRLYGDDYDREEDVTMVAVAGDQEGSSTGNSWEDSTCSEDDLLPGATPLVKDSQEILSERSKSNVKPLNKDRLMKFESSSSEEGSRNDVESPKPRKLWAQHENGCENGSEQDDMKGGGSVDAGRLRNLSSWSSADRFSQKPAGV